MTSEYFYVNLRGIGGLQARCKACQLSIEKKKRQESPGRKKPTKTQTRRGEDYSYQPKMPAIKQERSELAAQGKKRCLKCQAIKPLNGFNFKRTGIYSSSEGKDGFLHTCIDCASSPEEAVILRQKESNRIEKEAKRAAGMEQASGGAESKRLYKLKEKEERHAEIQRREKLKASGLCECTHCATIKPHDAEHFLWSRKRKALSDKCIECTTSRAPFVKKEPAPRKTDEEKKAAKDAYEEQRRRSRGQLPRVILSDEERKERERNQRRAARLRRKAREAAAEGEYVEHLFQDRVKMQQGKCFWTGEELPTDRSAYHADHVIPLVLGGDNTIWNMVAASKEANEIKRELMPWDFLGITFCEWSKHPIRAQSPVKFSKRALTEEDERKLRERYPRYPVQWLKAE